VGLTQQCLNFLSVIVGLAPTIHAMTTPCHCGRWSVSGV
jgi:hypothetical protein